MINSDKTLSLVSKLDFCAGAFSCRCLYPSPCVISSSVLSVHIKKSQPQQHRVDAIISSKLSQANSSSDISRFLLFTWNQNRARKLSHIGVSPPSMPLEELGQGLLVAIFPNCGLALTQRGKCGERKQDKRDENERRLCLSDWICYNSPHRQGMVLCKMYVLTLSGLKLVWIPSANIPYLVKGF